MSKAVQARLEAPGPKRMLALDGGGVRGIITLAFLEHVERLLAKRSKNPEAFRLSDYFDLIGGTSVGSITAVLLAMGYKVSEVTEIFFDWIPEIFANPLMAVPGVLPRFDARKLNNRIRCVARRSPAGDRRSEDRLRHHGKAGRHGEPVDPDQQSQVGVLGGRPHHNRQSPLSLGGLIRASTAAPYYFSPTTDRNSRDEVDRRIRRRRRLPAQQSRRCRCSCSRKLKGYKFNWPLGENKLLLISVGTGTYRVRVANSLLNRNVSALHAIDALQGVISDSQSLNLTLLQMLSKPTAALDDQLRKSMTSATTQCCAWAASIIPCCPSRATT